LGKVCTKIKQIHCHREGAAAPVAISILCRRLPRRFAPGNDPLFWGKPWGLTYVLKNATLLEICPSGGCPMQALFIALFAAVIAVADQITKYFTVANIPLYTDVEVLPGVVGLTYVQNFGAAFSSFQGMQWLFAIIFIAFTVAIVWEYKKKAMDFTSFEWWCIAAIYGGGLGNVIDRVRLGYVVDMIDAAFIDFPIFNVADCFITCGTVLFLVHLVLFNKAFWKDGKQ
jgi:signal peptidase II